MAAVDRLAEIGMGLAEALHRQATEPGAPRLFAGDLALAFSRIARAVRLTILLAQRLDDGLPDLSAADDADARAEAEEAAAEAEPAERLNERETEGPGAERGEREADESVWLKRPIGALAAQICRDLDQPYDAALWGDDEGPLGTLPPRWGKGRVGGVSAEPGRMALEGAGAERGPAGQFGANTPIPPLPPSRGKDAFNRGAGEYRPP
jgi:hypothetical protein